MPRLLKLRGFPKIPILGLILCLVALSVAAITIFLLYRTALKEETLRLIEAAQSQARLIEAVARFDSEFQGNFPGGPEEATLKQVEDAHAAYHGFGTTGEFTLAKKEGDFIIFLLSHRHSNLDYPLPFSMDSNFAEPMKRALAGESGSMIGLDYRGKKVLAAYEPVAVLDLGIVAKIDLSEVRLPFFRAGIISLLLTLFIAAIGVVLFVRITSPIIYQLQESELRNRYLIDTMTDGIGVLDENYRYTFVNQRLCDMLGFSQTELLGRSVESLLDKSNLEIFHRELADRRRGRHDSYELTFKRSDGQSIITMVSPQGIYDERGRLTGSFGVITDITDLKNAESKIRRERDFAESLVETAQAIIMVLDPDGGIIQFNSFMQEISGFRVDEVKGKNWLEIFLSDKDRDKYRAHFSESMENDLSRGIVNTIITKTGKERIIEWHDRALKDSNDQTIGLLAVGLDITERIEAENALRESEEWQRSIFEGSRDAIFIVGADSKIVDVNEAAVVLTGFSKDELLNINVNDLHQTTGKDEFSRFFTRVMSGQSITNEVTIKRKDGTFVATELSNRRIIVGGKVFMHTIVRDVSQRKAAQTALLESEMKFRTLFENANDAIFLWDLEGNFIEINRRAADLLGYNKEDVCGKDSRDFIVPQEHSEAHSRMQRLLAGEILPVYERTLLRKDGETIPVELNITLIRDGDGNPLFAQSIARDITQRRLTEEKIKASLKEKEVLLKEIHHRVKNNMQIMSSLLRLQAARIDDEKMRIMYLESQSRIRSMSLIHEKLYQSTDFAGVNFGEYVESLAVHLFQTYNISPERIKLHTELSDVYLEIGKAIPCGLIVNELISNSLRHAFPETRRGNIYLNISQSKGMVVIRVKDDGIGLPQNINLEDPPSLGLQLVGDLVRQLGGKLNLTHEKGAQFEVLFPSSFVPSS